jgi:thiosulfate/3-mercaptopyruvate sulfurtransferase
MVVGRSTVRCDEVLVTTAWLADHLNDPGVRIVDVRAYLAGSGRDGRAEYERGHLPGAVFLDWLRDLSAPDDPVGDGAARWTPGLSATR